MTDLPKNNVEEVISVFHQFPQLKATVYAFGSRTRGIARKNSDLDLVIKSDTPLMINDLYDIKDAFAESDIPYRVDLSDWSLLSDSFKKAIEHELVLVYKAN